MTQILKSIQYQLFIITDRMSSYNNKNSRSQRSKRDLHERTANFYNEKHWIGIETAPATFIETPNDHQFKENISKETKSDFKHFESRPIQSFEANISQHGNSSKKSPVELMQDILRVVQDGQQNRIYYSKEAEENLSELLTNRFKLNAYIKKLEADMVGLGASVVKNYEILALLLQQLGNADIEVKQGEQGMQLKFNRLVTERQQSEIERLERQKQEKEKQMKYITEQYQNIILNFNDVIEKLVNKEEGRYKLKQ